MAKSVRRRNIRRNSRRSRTETRNQRINRLNRSRKKRKGRNSLLNKKKRRVSRRKSNRRSKRRTKRRRSKSKYIEGGGEKMRTIGRSVARVYNAVTPSRTHMREYKSVPNEFKGFHSNPELEGRFREYLMLNTTLLTSAAAELGWYENSGELGTFLKNKGQLLGNFLKSLRNTGDFQKMLIKLFPRLNDQNPTRRRAGVSDIRNWCKGLSDEVLVDRMVNVGVVSHDVKLEVTEALRLIDETELDEAKKFLHIPGGPRKAIKRVRMEAISRYKSEGEAEVARLEAKIAEREEMLAECVAEGWDTSALEREMSSLRQNLKKYRAKVAARAEQAADKAVDNIESKLEEAGIDMDQLLEQVVNGPMRLIVPESPNIRRLAETIRMRFHMDAAWGGGLKQKLVDYVVDKEKEREKEREDSKKLKSDGTVEFEDITKANDPYQERISLTTLEAQPKAYALTTEEEDRAKMQAKMIFERAVKSSFSGQYKYMCDPNKNLSFSYLLEKSSQDFFDPFSKKEINEILSILLAVNCNLTKENKKLFHEWFKAFEKQVTGWDEKFSGRRTRRSNPPALEIKKFADIAKEGFKEPTKHTLKKDEPAVFPIHFSPQGDFARLYILWNAVDAEMRKSSDFVRCILAYIAVNTEEQEFISFLDHSLPNSPPAIPGFSAMKAIIDVQEGRTKGAKPLPNSSTRFPEHIRKVLNYSLSVYTVRQTAEYFCDIYSNRLADFAVSPLEDEQDIKQVAVQTWEYLWCTSGMVGFLFSVLDPKSGEVITRLETNLRDMRTGCHAFFKKHSKYCSKAWELFMDESGLKAKGKGIKFRTTSATAANTDGLVYYAKKYQINSLLESMGEMMVPNERGYYGIHIDDITRTSPNGENYMNVGLGEWEVEVRRFKSEFTGVLSMPTEEVSEGIVGLFWKFYYLIESITYDATLIARVAKKEMADAVFNQGDFSLRELIPLSDKDLEDAVTGKGPMYDQVTSDDTYSEVIDKFHTEVLEIESQGIARKIQHELFVIDKQNRLLDTINAPKRIEISMEYLSILQFMLMDRSLLDEYKRLNQGLTGMNEDELQRFAKGPSQARLADEDRLLNAQICLSLGILLKDIEKQLSREQLTAKLKSVDGFNEILVFDERMTRDEVHHIKKDVVQAAIEIDFEREGMELCNVCLGAGRRLSTVKVLPVEINRIINAKVDGIVDMYRHHGLFPFTPGGVDANFTINSNPKFIPICQSSLKAISLFMKTNQYAEMKAKFSVMMEELGRLLSGIGRYELSGLLSSRGIRMRNVVPVVAQLNSLIEKVLPIEREALFVKGYAQGGTLESRWWKDLSSFLENAYRYESDRGMGQKMTMKHEICEFEERIIQALRDENTVELEQTLNEYQNYILRRLLQSKTNHHGGMAPPLDNYDPRYIYSDYKFAEAILET